MKKIIRQSAKQSINFPRTIYNFYFKTIIFYSILCLSLFIFSGCSMERDQMGQTGLKNSDNGSLSLKITSEDTTVSSYNIKLSGPESQVINTNAGIDGIKIIDELTAGFWSIMVYAVNANNVSIGSKTSSANIISSQEVTRQITITSGTDLKGWEIDETNTGYKGNLTNFDVNGIDIGKGTYSNGYLTIYGNQLIENKRITWTYFCNISAGNITFRNCLFQPTGQAQGMPLLDAATGTIIEDCEVDASLCSEYNVNWSIGISSTGIIKRCNIHGMSTGISINNTGSNQSICENNYIHDLVWDSATDAHPDGITTRICSGSGGVLVKGNRVDVVLTTSAEYFIKANYGNIDYLIVQDNLLQGTTYCLNLDNTGAFSYGTHVDVINNRMQLYSGYGYVAVAMIPRTWSENYTFNASDSEGKGTIINR